MKGEHLVGNPREIILLRTAKTGSMSSYIFAPISKGARTSKLNTHSNISVHPNYSCQYPQWYQV